MPGETFLSCGLTFNTKELAQPHEVLQDKMCKCKQDGNVRVIKLTPGVRRDTSFDESSAIAYEQDLSDK